MRGFKFFHGVESCGLTGIWEPELNHNLNLYDDITHMLSEEIAREVDMEIIRQVTRRINGGENNNLQYLNHYINMEGGSRA
jgi:hypothetical protein